MDLELSDDQLALQAELRRLLDDRVTPGRRRAIADLPGAVDRDLWRELGSMGVFSLTLDEARGGVGLGLADATIAFEELGRACVPGPLIASHLAAGLVDGAAAGETVVGVVPLADAPMVEHLDGIDVLVGLGDGQLSLLEKPDGLALPRPLDPLTPVHLVETFSTGRALGDRATADRFQRTGSLLVAAFHIGLGQAAVEMGTQYAKDREQFGRPIGSFQAIKHLLADAVVAIDVARAAVHAAAVELDEAGEGGVHPRAVQGARITASRAANLATTSNIQVHGGIGFTWELDAHLLLKRVMVLDLAFGSVDCTIDALAASL